MKLFVACDLLRAWGCSAHLVERAWKVIWALVENKNNPQKLRSADFGGETAVRDVSALLSEQLRRISVTGQIYVDEGFAFCREIGNRRIEFRHAQLLGLTND
ncbi:MAG TPA: hypothetical protein VJJ47_00020 [Candidatus Paceibacterota bacterium]